MVLSARHRWPERAGFLMNRPVGVESYTFLHFHNAVEIQLNGQKVQTAPHACVLYNIGTPQWFHSICPLVHDWMHLDCDAAPPLERYAIPCDSVFYPSDTSFITAEIYDIELELLGKKPFRMELADLEVQTLLIRLSRARSETPDNSPMDPEMYARLVAFRAEMLTRLDEKWTAARMGRELQMSVPRLYACYRRIFGVPPVEDLIHARIDAAKNLLSTGNMSVSNLAYSLGYENITHFSRQFRQRVGVSPRDFARKYRNAQDSV